MLRGIMHRSSATLLGLPLLVACAADAPQTPVTAPPPVATAAPTTMTAAPPVTVRRSVIMNTRPSGSSVVTTAPDGTVTVAFDVHWNGRGPHADATIRLAADGTIASLEAHGHHMVGAPVDESFAVDAGRAHWKSHEEGGDRALSAPAFFVPTADLPDIYGLLAQALLKAGGTMALLPDGQATIARIADTTVTANGASMHLTVYDITGIDLVPVHVWMKDDGSWFGSIDPGFSVVPEGWEGVIDTLVQQQRQLDADREARIAQTLAHRPPAAGYALTHARVLDVERGKWIADQTVVVVGDTIRSVAPSNTAKIPAGAETVDLAGKAVLPGLWDMHTHLASVDGAMDLASGITTVRDCGNDPDRLDDLKARFDVGAAVGPHVLRAGLIEGRGEKAASSTITAETPAEAIAGVEFYAKRGYEMIKIYNSVKPELIPVITKAAHAHGMTVTGHIPVHVLANEAVKAGYDGIEHVNMVFLNFLADHDTETRTPLRFTLVGDKAADFDFDSKATKDFFALLRDHKTVVDPTLGAFEGLFIAQQGKVVPGTEWLVGRLPVQVQRGFLTGGLPLEGKAEQYARSWEKVVHMAKALADAKVTLVAGTDALAGLMLDHELELFVKAGLTPAEALRDSTLVPARAMKLDAKTGTVAVGKLADLAVIDGDPLANIADIHNVVTTLRAGVVYSSKDLFATVGVKYWQ
jgi:hypothetical protein